MANAESLNQVEPCAPNGVPDEVMTPAQERASMIERLRGVKMEMRELWQRIGKLEKELAAEQDEDVPLEKADTAAHRSRDQVLQVSSKSMEHCVTGIKAARVMLDDGWKGMQARQKRYEALEQMQRQTVLDLEQCQRELTEKSSMIEEQQADLELLRARIEQYK
jgi:septal ring factor EnvC (AmiA/AmiB activator)